MFEDLLTSLNVKEVNILAHDLGLTVALELLARQVNLWRMNGKRKPTKIFYIFSFVLYI